MSNMPQNPGAILERAASHQQRGVQLASTGRLAEAVREFETAAQLEPNNPVWHYNCALAWQQLNDLQKAIQAYQIAVQLAPEFFDAWNNLCTALKTARHFDLAAEAGRRAVSLRPQAAGAYLNWGNALKAQGDWAAAEAAYRRALSLSPSDPRTYLNLSNALREMGRVPEAIALLQQAIALAPDFAEAHRDLGFALLLSGDLLPGWKENEWRWKTEELSKVRRSFDQPRWNGEDLSGRTLLAYAEQGFGDAIQFVRYVPVVAKRGARVVLECQRGLKHLFETVPGVSQVIARGEPIPPFDFHLPLLSFPLALETTLSSIPSEVPYLRASKQPRADSVSDAKRRPKIGLVWAGNPAHQNDFNRSLPVQALRPALESIDAAFYSLQIGPRAKEVRALGPRVIDLAPEIGDFTDTAAVIEQLDLVISVDTAVAHLTGALAKPVWLLLPYAPDWRWLLGRDDSPWYPTMRLFRQERPGDWQAVIQRVASEAKTL